MEIEVYTSAKPAIPWRAWVASVTIFLGVCALAYSMSHWRGKRLLSKPIHHEGWEITYQVPSGFQPAQSEPSAIEPNELVMVYRNEASAGAEISVHRLAIEPGVSATRIAFLILDRQTPLLHRLLSVPGDRPAPQSRPIGTREGVEILDRATGSVVRAVIIGDRLAYAFALRVNDATFDAALYAFFDAACRSVQILNP